MGERSQEKQEPPKNPVEKEEKWAKETKKSKKAPKNPVQKEKKWAKKVKGK